MVMILRVATLFALLAPACSQSCDDIPAEAMRVFCSEDCPCCAAGTTDLLATKASDKAKLLFPTKTVGRVSLFPLPAKARGAKVVAVKRARKARSAEAIAKSQKAGIRSMKMLDRWKQDGSLLNVVKPTKTLKAKAIQPVGLYDVSDDDFHKTLMSTITETHTLQEFMAVKYPDEDWADLEDMMTSEGWAMEELAIHLYTTEDPNIYGPMNRMMRTAVSLDDIDEYWQSYMSILKRGLETYAPFVNVDTWRGVSDCSSLDALHVGDEGVLPSFTSTSTVKAAAAGFAQGCTLLHFTGGGYDVSSYSDFPGEAELLVEEGRTYTIDTAEQVCGDVGCFEQFDCETAGPADGVTGPTGDASTEPQDQDGVCAEIAANVPDFETAYCPYCACCVAPPPPPVQDDTNCCSCCSVGGACQGDVCEHSYDFGDVLALCNDAAAGNPDLFFGCSAQVQLATSSRVPTEPTVVLAVFGCMAAGMLFAGALVFSFLKKRESRMADAEQPYLSLVE